MLRILYSKEWKRRFEELQAREETLTKFYLDACEYRALRMNYCGINPLVILEITEFSIAEVREQIEKHKRMTLIEKMRYKG